MSELIPPRPDLPLGVPAAAPPPPIFDDLVPHATWKWWDALAVFVLGLFGGALLAAPIFGFYGQGAVPTLVASIIGEIVPGVALLFWLQRKHPGWKRAVGFPKKPWREIGVGVLAGIGIYVGVGYVIGPLLQTILHGLSGKPTTTPNQLPNISGGVRFALAAILALVAAPPVEELFFRGCLFRGIRERHGFALAAAGSALAFGLVHYIPGAWQDSLLLMTTMLFTGLGLATVYERRRNLVASIATHATFNVIGLLLILVFPR